MTLPSSVVAILGVIACMSFRPYPAVAQSVTPKPADAIPLSTDYAAAAKTVTDYIQTAFYLPDQGLYAHAVNDRHPDFMWGNGVMFTALLGAARHEPQVYLPVTRRFFKALDHYWDRRAPVPGYEPSPTHGGHDKYYDDNAWLVLASLEAFDMTQDRAYLTRAIETLAFVRSGWDDTFGGGIWWHELHKGDSKNTCSNAPAAVGCLRLANHLDANAKADAIAMAEKIVGWTSRTFETPSGLFADSMSGSNSGKDQTLNRDQLTYNTALMIRADLGLYRATQNPNWLAKAKRSAAASDWFLDPRTHAYRDAVKWSHLLVEADLELYRTTHEPYLLQRASNNANFEYAEWTAHHPDELIDNAAVARTLWLLADVQSESGRAFWGKMDGNGPLRGPTQ